MTIHVKRFNKEKAPTGHHGTILLEGLLPSTMDPPFGHAWAYLEDGAVMEGHQHPTEECYIVVEGEGTLTIGDEKASVSVGDVIEIPSHVYHNMSCDKGKSILWISLWW